ncbi:integral membrane protein 2B [Hyalella azteca]|uniref:Integral membrane protein 2 n=1 Tax=Hyalella azteca TaxID=294128 RepID=A0A8B7NSE9_HYAAZ|nr:integral membrane protein 2B [Hyalella azteca]
MTVITKPISENKVDKPVEKPLVVSVGDGVVSECLEAGSERLNGDLLQPPPGRPDEEELWSWSSVSARRHRRVSVTTTVCLFVGALVTLAGIIIGGVCVHRHLTQNKVARFHGWCGVPFNHTRLRALPQPMHQHHLQQPASRHWPRDADGLFSQRFDLDLGSDSYEYIYVPDFGIGREGKFVHDYKLNLTAIVDEDGKRCFVFPLDHLLVSTPGDTFAIIRRMKQGFYEGNMAVVREMLRVVRPPLRDLSSTGPYITSACHDYTTYRLEKRVHVKTIRFERSVDTPEEREEFAPLVQTPNHFTVAEFTGKAIVEYTVLDE